MSMEPLPSDVRDYLSDVRSGGGLKRILDLIESVKDYRVLLIGDYIKDEYVYVDVLGKSPKETMIAVHAQSKESWGGGVYAAARHLAAFVKGVDLVTMVHPGANAKDRTLPPNVMVHGPSGVKRPVTTKTRFVERSYMRKLFEVYTMDDTPLDEEVREELVKDVLHHAGFADMIMATDFGHGLIDDRLLGMHQTGRFLAVAPQTNSANVGFNLLTKYVGISISFSCLDEPEARLAVGNKHKPIDEIGLQLQERMGGKLVITKGKQGCFVFGYHGDHFGTPVPALTNTVVDTVGAGDAFFSVTAPMVKAGGDMRDIGLIGNAAGALKVQIVGHTRSVTKPDLINFITGLLE